MFTLQLRAPIGHTELLCLQMFEVTAGWWRGMPSYTHTDTRSSCSCWNNVQSTQRPTTCCNEIFPNSINFIWFTCCSMHVLNKQPTLYPEPDAPLALYFDRWWQSVSSRLALLLLLPLSSLSFGQKLNRRVVTAAHKLSSQNRSGSVLVLRGVLAVRGRAWQRGCGSCYRPPRSREPSARRTLFSDGHAPFTTAAFTSVGYMRCTYLSAYWHQDWSYFCYI